MVDTYAWVEHHCSPPITRGRTTEEWVMEQQSVPRSHRGVWDGILFAYDDESWRRMREEEQIRLAAAEKAKQRARIIDERLRDIESRIRHRREVEKERLAAERWQASEERKERDRIERERTNQATRDAWRRYEKGWEDIARCPDRPISFSTIPWPLASMPKRSKLDEITANDIGFFLLSPLHSEGQAAKERIRRAQLIWHPDRFQKVLGRVTAADKTGVETGAGIVARCLNDLMARETGKARR